MLTSASNKTISDSVPSKYLPSVLKAAGKNLSVWLDSNLIPSPAFEAALQDNFEKFLNIRAEYIHGVVLAKTGWSSETGAQEQESDSAILDEDSED